MMNNPGGAQPILLPDWLGQRARLSPKWMALLVGGRRWTFAELNDAGNELAQRLASLGVGRGDRVAVLARNGYPFVALVHALTRLDAVLIPLNARLTAGELAWQLADAGASWLVHDAPLASLAAMISREQPERRRLLIAPDGTVERKSKEEPAGPSGCMQRSRQAPSPPTSFPDRRDLSSVQSIIYTSGTTGHPKGALITYGNLWWSAAGSALNLGHHHDDRWLACLPLFHIGGLSILFRSVIYGIPVVVHESFDAAAVNRAIDNDGVTIISVVSTMLQRMLDARGARPYPPSLRCVLLGGGPAPRPLLEACAERNVPVVQTYGLTETASQVATLAPADALRKLGSAGKPLLPTELRIERDGVSVQAGEAGEIVVRGPTVTPGYLNRPDATRRALRDDWLHTGDLGYFDDEGYLYVLDRRDDLIVSGGENVYPAEVESALLAHPSIEEAGVIGIPDDRWGQIVVAVVRFRPGSSASVEELRAFSRQRLAGYKTPTALRRADALPRNGAGKLLRRTLRERWESYAEL